MNPTVTEIADNVFRISIHTSDGLRGGLTYNQFVIRDEEPILIHTGMRTIFPVVSAAVARVITPESIRWISGGHASRPDEFGSVNEWLALAPHATVIHGRTACNVCLRNIADKPPHPLSNNQRLDIGEHQLVYVDTPHVPFWEAGLFFDLTTDTLFCGDLFTMEGDPPAITSDDIVGPTLEFEARMRHFCPNTHTIPTLRSLAALQPKVLGIMHGPAYSGPGSDALNLLADHYEGTLQASALN